MNIKEIAKIAGVSISSVSRVLNNQPGVKPEIRSKVKKIIKDKKYRPNLVARGLVQKKTNVIGVMIPKILGYYSRIIDSFMKVFYEEGFGIMTASSFSNFKGEIENFYLLLEKQVDGVLYIPAKVTDGHMAALKEVSSKIPVVTAGKSFEELNLSSVIFDDYKAALLAVEYIIELGHREIAYIGGPEYHVNGEERYKAYRNVLKKNKIKFNKNFYRRGSYSIYSGYDQMKDILNTNDSKPTALFAANDDMALGAINAIYDYGLKVPDDISVIGVDDISMASNFRPKLSTIRQDRCELGRISAELLLNEIKSEKKLNETIVLDSELIIRESTIKR